VTTELLQNYKKKVFSALKHLNYSLNIAKNLETLPSKLSEDQLASWEALTSRFARVVDIFLTKYLKLQVKLSDPAFDGSLLDFLNQAEKMGLIKDPMRYLNARKLRNQEAHEYEEYDLGSFFEGVRSEATWIAAELPQILK
jgi:hypothetical protein